MTSCVACLALILPPCALKGGLDCYLVSLSNCSCEFAVSVDMHFGIFSNRNFLPFRETPHWTYLFCKRIDGEDISSITFAQCVATALSPIPAAGGRPIWCISASECPSFELLAIHGDPLF